MGSESLESARGDVLRPGLSRHGLGLSQLRATAALVLVLAFGAALVAAGTSSGEPADPPRSAVPQDNPAADRLPDDVPAAPEGTVVDNKGRPLADVAVFLSPRFTREPDGSVPTLGQAFTDAQGRFQMAAPPLAAFKGHPSGTLWAYRPGLAFGATRYAANQSQKAVRIQLLPPNTRTVMLQRADGSPAVGVKVAPSTGYVQEPGARGQTGGLLPDALAELMAQVSDERGQVALALFPPIKQPESLRVWSRAGGSQVVLPSERRGGDASQWELIFEPAGALAGLVRRSDGQSPEGLFVQVEAERRGPVRLEDGPLRVDADRRFHTPPILLAGYRYRVVIQGEGQVPCVSPWIEPAGDGQTATLGELVVKSLHQVVGLVVDRQGKPIAGAEVSQAGDGPEWTETRTDAEGRFRLGGYEDERGLVFARAEGFRFGGRVIAPGENTVVLTRVSEAPERAMPTLRPDLPADELRALARRVIEPYLQGILKTDADAGKYRALSVLAICDPPAALAMLPKARLFARGDVLIREAIAVALARTDVDQGVAVAETTAGPGDQAEALLGIVDTLPAERRATRLALLEKAAARARAATSPGRKIWFLADVGERLLDEGEAAMASTLFEEAQAEARARPNPELWREYAARLARVDLPAALKLIDQITMPRERARALANTAAHIAASQPAECERLLKRLDESDTMYSMNVVCDRMVRTDPVRARRLALGTTDPYLRGCRGIILARGLARQSRTEAEAVFRQALADLDASERDRAATFVSQALHLPLVEEIDPALVPEFLWRTLSLRKPATGLGSAAVRARTDAQVVTIVAHYDREIAAALWTPIPERIRTLDQESYSWFSYSVVVAQAYLDPRAAVAWLESRPEPAAIDENGQNEPRFVLSNLLGLWSVGRQDRFLNYMLGPAEELARRDLRP